MIKEVLETIYFNLGWKVIAIIVFSFILWYILNSFFSKLFVRIRNQNKKGARIKITRLELMRKATSTLIFILAIIAILFMIPGFSNLAYSLVAGAGFAAIILGFAAQKTLGNVLAGISIAVYAPFRVGDKLNIFDQFGEVEDLTLRHTVIKTWDNKRLVVPNSTIDNKEVINFSLGGEEVLWTQEIRISYDSDIDKAKKLMLEEVKKHKDNLAKKEGKEKEPFVRVVSCEDFFIRLRAYYWCEDAWVAWRMSHELIESIKKKFDKEGIEIPYPYRTIVYKKDFEGKNN